MPTKLLPLQHPSVEDLFLLAYVYVDDYLKAAVVSGLFTLPNEPHQKATYAELMAIALVGEWLDEVSQQKWYRQLQSTYRSLFPRLPDRTRYLRIQLNFDNETVYVIDSKPLVCCAGTRFARPRAMSEAVSGRGDMVVTASKADSTATSYTKLKYSLGITL